MTMLRGIFRNNFAHLGGLASQPIIAHLRGLGITASNVAHPRDRG